MASGNHLLPEWASCGTKTGTCPQWCGAGVGGRLRLGASFRLTTLELRDPHRGSSMGGQRWMGSPLSARGSSRLGRWESFENTC